MDDIILFRVGNLEEWEAFAELLELFCIASGMCISVGKSTFLVCNVGERVLNNISGILPFKMDSILVGFKYLGYYLKPLGYGIKDWNWILNFFERMISH